MDTNRRALLRRLGATGGITLLGGCTGDLPIGESDDGSDQADDESDQASITFDDQSFDGESVTVASASLPEGGFVIIYGEGLLEFGTSDYLSPGTHESITIELAEENSAVLSDDWPEQDEVEALAILHYDSNDNESLDFQETGGEKDGWYHDDGTRIQSRATLAVEGTNDESRTDDAMLWHSLTESEIETFEESRELFNDARDPTIVADAVGDLRNRIETTLASGDGPEMYRWAQDWAGNHYERDFLYDASDDLDIDLEETFSSPAVEAITTGPDDAVVGLPVGGETVSLLYNTDMVDEPPETFAEMESIMQEHHDPTQGQFGLSHPIDAYFASAWMHAFGGYYFQVDENGEGVTGLDLDATKRGMEFVRDHIWPYVPNATNPGPQQQVFQDGNAPLAVNGPWMIDSFENNGLDIGVTSFPTVDGHTPAPYTGTSMWYFSARMGDDAERREAALDYAEWISTSRDRQLAYAEEHRLVPVLSSVNDDSLGEQVAGFKGSYDEGGIAMPNHPRMSSVWTPTEDAMYDVLQNGADIDPRFDEAAATIRSNWRQ